MVGSTLLSAPMSFRCLSTSSPAKDAVFLRVFMESAAITNETMVFPARSEVEVVYDNQCHPEMLTSPLLVPVFSSPHPVPTLPSPLSPPASVNHLRTTTLLSCPQVEYDTSVFQETIISEFNLICERTALRPLYQMLYSVGAMIGGPIGGIFSDRYGRRRAIQVSSMVNLVSVVVIAASPWYAAVLLARLLLGLSTSTMLLPAFSLAQEVTPPRLRTVMGMGLGTSFSLAFVVFAGFGYLLRSWRLILLSATSLLLPVIPLSFIMKESPRWLVQHGRGAEAAHMLTSAFQHNRATLSPTLLATIHKLTNQTENERKAAVRVGEDAAVGVGRVRVGLQQCWGYLHLPGMRTILLVTPLVWLLHSFLYFGVILNANNFTSNNPFLYVALSGVMDGSAILLTIPLATRLGRRQLTGAAFLLSGILLILDLAVPTELAWIEWILVMFAFFLAAAALQVSPSLSCPGLINFSLTCLTRPPLAYLSITHITFTFTTLYFLPHTMASGEGATMIAVTYREL
nr:organic cation transporter protein-like [Procambarus clarkii]